MIWASPRRKPGSRTFSVVPANDAVQKVVMERNPCVYIMASERNGTLYVGVTSDLVKRVWEHKNDAIEGFTKKYGVHKLVWFEPHETMDTAIQEEKRLKEWNRKWKLELIESRNPEWLDLYNEIV